MIQLNNYVTASKARVKADKNTPAERMQELLEQVRPQLYGREVYRAKADINGIIVQLISNVRHQYEFWLANWVIVEESTAEQATLYSVNGVLHMEPSAYYSPDLHTSLFVNTEYYGQCKSWALGMAAAILEKNFNTLSIHGALASFAGKGVVIVAPTGTGKTTQAFKLFLHPEGKIIGDDWVYVKFPDRLPSDQKPPLVGSQPEKSLYMRTETQKDQPWLREVFDRCKVENVTVRKEDCEYPVGDEECGLTGGKCVFNQGFTHCYYAFGNSRAMVPREALLGPEKVADSAEIRLIVLLRRDDHSPAEVVLDLDQAIKVLKKGEYQIRPGAGPKEQWGQMGYEPWYNPYLLELDHHRQERYFRLIFEEWGIPCVLLNTGVETVDETHESVLRHLVNA